MKASVTEQMARRTVITLTTFAAWASGCFPWPVVAQAASSAPTDAQVSEGAALSPPATQSESSESRPRFGSGPVQGRVIGSGSPSPGRLSVYGIIRPKAEIELRAGTCGVIEKVGFHEGATVRKGQLLVELASPGLAAESVAAEEQFKRTDLEYRRLRAVADQHAELVAAGSLEQAKAALEKSRANLEVKQEQSARTRVLAPWDGVIGASKLQPGQAVTSNTVLASLYDLSAFKVEFPVSEAYI
jgi:multidrug efflux pump subunit AcrA (membrane-fusion protein)